MQNLITQINEALTQADTVNLEKSKDWACKMFDRIKEYKSNTPISQRSYDTMFEICGGKVWYEQTTYGQASLLAFVEKNSKNNATKRNAKIAAQLEKAGITKVLSGGIEWNADGFNGVFTVQTEQGEKRVTIETIYAGGYNIQCFHLRVLVKIK